MRLGRSTRINFWKMTKCGVGGDIRGFLFSALLTVVCCIPLRCLVPFLAEKNIENSFSEQPTRILLVNRVKHAAHMGQLHSRHLFPSVYTCPRHSRDRRICSFPLERETKWRRKIASFRSRRTYHEGGKRGDGAGI